MAQTNKPVKTRIVHKHEKAENWAAATNFTPLSGELIVYEYGKGETPKLKIGDGETNVNELPFIDDSLVTKDEVYIKSENGSFATGENTTASGINSSAEGKNTVASGWHSHAEGHASQATGYGAHAENGQTKAIGGYSHAEGYLSKAEGSQSHSEGQSTQAIGNNSHAEGQETQATGDCSHTEGLLTVASGTNSHAEGLQTQALSIATSATGLLTKAGGKAFKVVQRMEISTEWGTMSGYTLSSMTGIQAALAEAASNGQSLYYAVHMAETDYYELGVVGDVTSYPNTLIGGGYSNTYPMTDLEKALIPSNGSYLLIAGYPQLGEIEIGVYATAEGVGSCAQHYAAHAEGVSTYAIGPGAHAEGVVAHAVHMGSHAEGYHTVAGGAHSHAGGSESEAGGENAFAHGEKVYAYGKNQTVFGQYNKEDPDALFIVGGGDSEENRKNLFVVKKDGSIVGLNTSNALTKTVSGEVVRIDDASPIEHEMGVNVRSKNLINLSDSYVTSGGEMTIDGTTITLTRKATGNPPSIIWELGAYKDFVGKTLTISFVLDAMGSSGGTNVSAAMNIHCGNTTKEAVESVSSFSYTSGRVGTIITKTFTVPALDDKGRQLCIRHYMNNGKTERDYLTISNIQVEEGTTATAYTPFIEDISTVKVKKYGKNLADIYGFSAEGLKTPEGNRSLTNNYGTTISTTEPSNSVVITQNQAPGSGNSYTNGFIIIGLYNKLKDGDSITLSFDLEVTNNPLNAKYMGLLLNNGTMRSFAFANGRCAWTFPWEAGDGRQTIEIRLGGCSCVISNIQLEMGNTATEYEPFNGMVEYPVLADGIVEGVTSIYPTTTLITDTAGALIDCTYNRDINRVLDDTGFMYDNNPVGTGSFSMNRKVGSEVGDYSFTEGYSATAAGRYSHGGGEASQAKGVGSFAHGQRVTADADYQATFGTYNEVNTNAALIVGNGNGITKSNAFEVQKEGNAFVKGSLYVGGTGSTQASAKPVATQDSVSTMEQRINNLENITSSMGGVFFEDADVAYVKTIPENVAPYASLNKVGGLGIYQKKLVNLIPSTYDTANGTVSGYHTFNSNADGVITIVDRTPVEEWTSEPWFNAEISLNTIELPAGTYTAAIYADNPEGSPFGLYISGGDEDIRVGGAWGWEYAESPVTFVLTETTWLNIALKFDCGGSLWIPTGDVEVCHFRVMLNEGDEAMPWESYSENPPAYIEPPKVTSIDIIGKNVLDYGEPRIIQDGNANTEGETYFEIRDNGTLYIRDMRIPVPMGPDSIYGTSITATIPLDVDIIYPAGTYSMGASVEADGLLYFTARAKSLDGTQSIMIQGSNNIISTPFTIQSLELTYEPSYESYSMPNVEVPLVLVRGAVSPVGVIPFKRSHITIPETLLSRGDYGIGVYDTRSGTLYTNSIDFDNKKYLKNCLIYELYSQSFFLDLHESKINTTIAVNTIQCSDPKIAVDVYENSDTDPNRRLIEIYAYSADPDNPIDNIEDYLTNNPIKVLFGTNLTEEIDISAELAGIDNYISVEAGGLIIFNNDQQADVPSTIEYQSMIQEGETE